MNKRNNENGKRKPKVEEKTVFCNYCFVLCVLRFVCFFVWFLNCFWRSASVASNCVQSGEYWAPLLKKLTNCNIGSMKTKIGELRYNHLGGRLIRKTTYCTSANSCAYLGAAKNDQTLEIDTQGAKPFRLQLTTKWECMLQCLWQARLLIT